MASSYLQQGEQGASSSGGKVTSALGYNAFAIGSIQGLSLLKGVILARLLTPEAFGLFGVATMTLEALSALSNFNLKNLLITMPFDQQDSRNRWLDTVWLMEIVRSVVIAVVVWVFSAFISSFYNAPELHSLLLVAGCAVFIAGLSNSAFTLYQREIEYKRVVLLELCGAIAGFVVTIGLAFWYRNAMAFVWGMVAANIFKVTMSFVWHTYRPSIRFDEDILRKCLGYGKYYLVISLLTYMTTQFDNLVLGKYLGLASLGIYLVAYKMAMIPVDLMLQVVNRVALPAYAGLYRDNPSHCFEKWSLNFICLGWVFAISSSALWIGGDYFISLIYGPQWVPPAGVFLLLVGAGLFRGLTHVATSLVLAVNRPDVDAKAKIAETIVFVLLVLLLVPQFGMLGAGFAGLVCYGMAVMLRVWFVVRLRPEVRRHLFSGVMRWSIGGGLLFAFNGILGALSLPLLIRLALVVLLVLPLGAILEPQLRIYLRLIWTSEGIQSLFCRLTALRGYLSSK